MKVFIHTRDDVVLEFRERTRPPKSYFRFRDLMQQTLAREARFRADHSVYEAIHPQAPEADRPGPSDRALRPGEAGRARGPGCTAGGCQEPRGAGGWVPQGALHPGDDGGAGPARADRCEPHGRPRGGRTAGLRGREGGVGDRTPDRSVIKNKKGRIWVQAKRSSSRSHLRTIWSRT